MLYIKAILYDGSELGPDVGFDVVIAFSCESGLFGFIALACPLSFDFLDPFLNLHKL